MGEGFNQAEINMITSTIDLRDKKVHMIMVPISEIFTINRNSIHNKDLMARISTSGYSYIGIYEN